MRLKRLAGNVGMHMAKDTPADIDQDTGSQDFACNICGDRFDSKHAREAHVTQSADHVRVSDRDECPNCGDPFEYAEPNRVAGTNWDVTVVHEVSRTETGVGAFADIEDRCLIYDAEA